MEIAVRDRKLRPRELMRSLGPGLIAGASDNDPTTVATMSVAGATTGFALSWLVVLTLPMLATVQIIAAQVGIGAKAGLQELVRLRFGRRWGVVLLLSVLAVNVITIGADLEAGAAAIGLILRAPERLISVPYAVLLLVLLIVGSYDEIQRILKYVLLVFVAYAAAAFLAHPQWATVLTDTVVPHLSLSAGYAQAVLAILGTTLTSYAYLWEVEEESEQREPIARLNLVRMDAGLGMVVAVAVFWFILIATGATLGQHHAHVETADQAAEALRPVAGPLASYLFGIGLLASSFIAVPVLVLVSARLVSEEFGWQAGLSMKLLEAKKFYALVAAGLGIGALISLLGISPIGLLFWASIAGGLGTPISLVFLLLIARDRKVMDSIRIGKVLLTFGWLTAGLVAVAGLVFLYTQIF